MQEQAQFVGAICEMFPVEARKFWNAEFAANSVRDIYPTGGNDA